MNLEGQEFNSILKMKKSVLIFGCLLVVSIQADFEVIPRPKWDNFYGDVCNVTEGPYEKFMDHVNFLGIAAGLVVLLPLLPEAIIAAEAATFLATTLGGIYGIAVSNVVHVGTLSNSDFYCRPHLVEVAQTRPTILNRLWIASRVGCLVRSTKLS